nr:alk-exo [Cnaphalocrocis medinalis granulovirus]
MLEEFVENLIVDDNDNDVMLSSQNITNFFNKEQKICYDKFHMDYFKDLIFDVNQRVHKDDIMFLEKMTRGQNTNFLWRIMRWGRQTASNSNYNGQPNLAMQYGLQEEEKLKNNHKKLEEFVQHIEEYTNLKVTERVINCGMFITEMGLYSASPDGYFVLENGNMVVLEIKCPITYDNMTLDQYRQTKKLNRNRRIKVDHTAFYVNLAGDEIELSVEKRNPHYRQMQHQMYVTGAVCVLYVVKFAQNYEYKFVTRDEDYIKDLYQQEYQMLQRLVKHNITNGKYLLETNRLDSFLIQYNINDENNNNNFSCNNFNDIMLMLHVLAKDGFYYIGGDMAKCYFCQRVCDNLQNVDYITNIINTHQNCNKNYNIPIVTFHNKQFLNVCDRLINLINTGLYDMKTCADLANQGFYHNNQNLVLYCCGSTNNEHDIFCTKNTNKIL